MAYTSSSGGYKIVDGTQADPLWIGDAGLSGYGDVAWFVSKLCDDSTVAVMIR